MNLSKIYEIGAMLGIEEKEIRDLTSNLDEPIKSSISTSNPIDVYKTPGIKYGSISIKDFK